MKKTGSIQTFVFERHFESVLEIDSQFKHTWEQSSWNEFLTNQSFDLEVLELGENSIGFSLFSLNPFQDEAHLLKIVIDNQFRGQGHGKALLQHAIKKYSDNLKIFLEVHVENTAAIGLYESLGFERLNVVKRFYKNGGNALRMFLNPLNNLI
jgi:ribosomal-protein-alanine N-acetyltransferase